MPLPPLLALYAVVSTVALLAYALDKHAARAGGWRLLEKLLHVLSLAGGWPGALLAQRVLRHKCSKRSFLAVFWLTVALNLCLLWLALQG